MAGKTRYFPRLVGPRCYLSPINPDDVELYAEWFADTDVIDGLGGRHLTFTLIKEKEILERLAGKPATFAIVDRVEDRLIGGCSLNDIRDVDRTAELGIFIGPARYRNRGYGQEAIGIISAHGFDDLNLRIVSLHVFAYNELALRCYEKVGFRECGRLPGGKYRQGEYHDIIQMYVDRNGLRRS